VFRIFKSCAELIVIPEGTTRLEIAHIIWAGGAEARVPCVTLVVALAYFVTEVAPQIFSPSLLPYIHKKGFSVLRGLQFKARRSFQGLFQENAGLDQKDVGDDH